MAIRRDGTAKPKAAPERAPEVEIIPRPTRPGTEKESARLKEPPPVPVPPRADNPARINPAPLQSRPPVRKVPDTKPDPRQADTVPNDIDKLPRGRKIPMDEIEPPKPRKKLRERLPI